MWNEADFEKHRNCLQRRFDSGPLAPQYIRKLTTKLQLGLRMGGHLALTDFHSDDPMSSLTWLCRT